MPASSLCSSGAGVQVMVPASEVLVKVIMLTNSLCPEARSNEVSRNYSVHYYNKLMLKSQYKVGQFDGY
jgi:hypothetical protein